VQNGGEGESEGVRGRMGLALSLWKNGKTSIIALYYCYRLYLIAGRSSYKVGGKERAVNSKRSSTHH